MPIGPLRIGRELDAHITKLQNLIMTMENIFEKELFDLLSIPSVSAQTKHFDDCIRAAEFMQKALEDRGFGAQILATGKEQESYPVVLGKWEKSNAKSSDATLLIYGHYDVQPPEPFDLWQSPPFSPTIRDGKVYARGATDDKGQIYALICGLGKALAENGELPLRIIFLIEGEEEIGSPHLDPFIQKHLQGLRCDCVLVSDSPQLGPGIPAICIGLKGLTYFEINVQGPKRDLHSGSFGGLAQNPAVALARLLSSLSDQEGRISIEGFYDSVLELSQEERKMMAELPYDEEAVKSDLGLVEFFGDKQYSPRERRWARPTFDIHGLTSGYQEEGAKTVIPSKASAKFGFRLVANQKAKTIEELLKAHLKINTPPGCTWNLQSFHNCDPVNIDYRHPMMDAASLAIQESFGKKPVFIREGGSIPVVTTFQTKLKALPLLIGLGLSTDGAHAPNEHFTLADFHRGIEMARVLPEKLAYYFKEISC
jgi:acetylornithine deacetylase/succinyl-diaminopimelate desuccinylase-like protein